VSRTQPGARKNKLKLRSIGINDYSVLGGRQRIGRIRFADEHMPAVWLWSVTIHLTGDLPMGSFQDLNTARAEGPSRMEGDPMITDEDCDYQAGPSIENKQRHEALAATWGE